MTTVLILAEVGHVFNYVKNIFTCKKYENIEITDGEPSKGIEDVWVSIQESKFKSIIDVAVYKHPNINPDCIAYLERMLQTYSNCGKKHVYAR